VIGIGAVIMIVSLGNGLRRSTQQQLEAWSAGTVEIRPQYLPYMMGVTAVPVEQAIAAEQKMCRPVGSRASPSRAAWRRWTLSPCAGLPRAVVEVVPLYETWAQ